MVFKVTPWEVTGKVDYDKLRRDFGAKPIDKKLKNKIKKNAGNLHHFLRRDFFFSHRDFDLILKDYENQKDIQIPDEEKFLHKQNLSWETVQDKTKTDLKHIASLGFNQDKTFLFQNSEYIKNMYPMLMKTAKKITHSTMKAVFGFKDSTNIGMSFYPSIQIVPTFFEKKRCVIPCAIDQDNYWRPQRDIAEKLGFYKTATIHSKFLPPLTGVDGKMSASKSETAIYLSDSEDVVKKKVMKYAFSGGQPTLEEHRKKGGNPELKQILVDKINKFLKEHNKKKGEANKIVDKLKYSGKLAKEMWNKTI